MLTKSLRGNQNFIPIMIFILWAIGFFLLNVNNIDLNQQLISFGLMSVTVGSSIFVVNNFPYFKNNFYFAFLFSLGFLLLGCCLENLNFFAGLFFLYLILSQVLYINQKEHQVFNAFDLGFYVGIAIIFYPPFWVFGLFLLLHFVVLGKTQIVNLILSLVGTLALFILCLQILAIFDSWHYWDDFVEQLSLVPMHLDLDLLFLAPLVLVAIVGLVDYYTNINRQSANKKAVFFDAMLWFLFAVIFNVLYGGNNDNGLLLLVLPVVLYTSNLLTYSINFWKSEVILWLFVICLVLYRFHPYIKVPELFDTVTF